MNERHELQIDRVVGLARAAVREWANTHAPGKTFTVGEFEGAMFELMGGLAVLDGEPDDN